MGRNQYQHGRVLTTRFLFFTCSHVNQKVQHCAKCLTKYVSVIIITVELVFTHEPFVMSQRAPLLSELASLAQFAHAERGTRLVTDGLRSDTFKHQSTKLRPSYT